MLLNRDRAYQIMDQHGLDGLVGTMPINLQYLTDFNSPLQRMGLDFSSFAVLPRNPDAPAALIISTSSLPHLERAPSWVPNICAYAYPRALTDAAGQPIPILDLQAIDGVMPWPRRDETTWDERDRRMAACYDAVDGRVSATPILALVRALREAGLARGRVGFDDPRILTALHGIDFAEISGIDAWNVFRAIRMVKTEPEIALLREAGQKNEAAMEAAIATIRVGTTQEDIEAAHRIEWARQGGQQLFIVAQWRGLSTGTIRRGDIMKLDGVGTYRGYTGDIGRAVVCGEPTEEMLRRSRAVDRGLEFAYDLIRPGMTGPEVRTKVVDLVRREGFENFGAAGPHSVGLTHTDNPWPVGADRPDTHGPFVFLENMVMTLDMPHHEFGWGTYHVEDMVVIRPWGCELLTSGRTELRVAPG